MGKLTAFCGWFFLFVDYKESKNQLLTELFFLYTIKEKKGGFYVARKSKRKFFENGRKGW